MNKQVLNILIVEDDFGFSDLLCRLARQQGHSVLAVIGAVSVQPMQAIGRDKQPVAVPVEQFDLALCDYGLKQMNGPEPIVGSHFVDVLVPAGVVCHAMGSYVTDNAKMVSKGAKSGLMKPVMLLALKDGVVSFHDLFHSPEQAKTRLEGFLTEQLADAEAFQQRIMSVCEETETVK